MWRSRHGHGIAFAALARYDIKNHEDACRNSEWSAIRDIRVFQDERLKSPLLPITSVIWQAGREEGDG